MNLIEAIKSGRRFRRSSWTSRDYYPTDSGWVNLPIEAVVADDWEVEEPTSTITLEQFDKAWSDALEIGLPNNLRAYKALRRGLGL
jgi:hypothetical protein